MNTSLTLKLQLLFSFIYVSTSSIGQIAFDSLQSIALQPVTVTATRLEIKQTKVPFALSTLEKSILQTGQQQLSINEFLSNIPGVFALNPDNFAQDSRVSIRGFGARSAFGIRGIKLLVDGIPESTPDGQAQVDNIDFGHLQRAEVIRGPSSGLYGNASGGVISLVTEDFPDKNKFEARIAGGSFGFRKYQLKGGQQLGKFAYLLNLSEQKMDGYREQSEMKNTLVHTKFQFQLSDSTTFTLLLNYMNSPIANDAGGLTVEQIAENRRLAREQNITFMAGESVKQGRAGLLFKHHFNTNHSLQFRSHYTFRDFENKLPFVTGGIVELTRNFTGIGASYLFSKPTYQLHAGIDVETQSDLRLRHFNMNGLKGDSIFHQKETFTSTGIFIVQQWHITNNLSATASTRLDMIKIKATDSYLADGDDSDEKSWTAFNPMFGLSYQFTYDHQVYGNISTSFETPALSELSANPDGSGGFNELLRPQKATNFELGFKGFLKKKLRYDFALFNIEIKEELIPFELENFPGRTFFQNAGRSNRKGMELGLKYAILNRLFASVNYTFSNFKFKEFTSPTGTFDGNRLPGIPQHTINSSLQYFHKSGWFGIAQMQWVGALYVNNSNELSDQAYMLINFRTGYRHAFRKSQFEPFFGINNVLNSRYHSNIRINAFGNRFFEPATRIHFFGGLKITLL